MRPSHLKPLLRPAGGPDSSRSAIHALTHFCNKIADGDMPELLKLWFASGTLIALPKSPTKIRPIAIGILLRRLIGKILAQQASSDSALQYLHPHQLAVGTRGGSGAIIHATRAAVHQFGDGSHALLQVDASNTFNRIERFIILREIIRWCPEIARYVHLFYEAKPFLLFGSYTIMSKTGTQQGDPLSMLLFARALHILVKKLVEQFSNLPLCARYADDGNILVERPLLNQILHFMESAGQPIGFHINLSITVAWFPHALPHQIRNNIVV